MARPGGQPAAPWVAEGLLWSSFVRAAEQCSLWPLSEQHWQVAHFVLGYYRRHSKPPAVVRVARATGLSSRRLFELFPHGPTRTVLGLAGLPDR
jgi:sulfur relay (sulfurtransferase) DsrC/TusE family protein